MKTVVLAFIVAVVCPVLATPVQDSNRRLWMLYKQKFNKAYGEEEDIYRMKVWEAKIAEVQRHNLEHSLGLRNFTMGINQFSDLTTEEYVRKTTCIKKPTNLYGDAKITYDFSTVVKVQDLPLQVDWRDKGCVTPVKDQGDCGACWAFAATGALEGQQALKSGTLVSLSEENLIDCSQRYGNRGCNGGWPDSAFSYIRDNNGIDTEDSYPYEGTYNTPPCRFNASNIGASCTGIRQTTPGSETSLLNSVAKAGPLSVCIDASQSSFGSYSAGVYSEPNCKTQAPTHGVLVVGYGSDGDGQDYWLIKNTWGTSWGIAGYMKMARNQNNMCGIASYASYPMV